MPRLDIVVAEGLSVVAEVVYDLGGHVGAVGLHVVVVVAGGLSLQYVAVVQQDEVLAVLCALLLDVGTDACHRTLHGAALDEVVGEEDSVHVGGLNEP